MRVTSSISQAGIEVLSVRIRYAWPADLDLAIHQQPLGTVADATAWADWAGDSIASSESGVTSAEYETAGKIGATR